LADECAGSYTASALQYSYAHFFFTRIFLAALAMHDYMANAFYYLHLALFSITSLLTLIVVLVEY